MEFQKICQKYFNRYINSSELQAALKELDLSKLSDDEQVSFNALVISIDSIINETDNKPDELVESELKSIEEQIRRFEDIIEKNKEKVPDEFKQHVAYLKEASKKPRDNFERWSQISDAIKQNKYYQGSLDSLSDSDLLKLIAQDIKAPRPIPISEEKYNQLVEAGKKEDARESLWRLALNYYEQDYNVETIADFYFEKKDFYYLSELISAVGEKLDIPKILERLTDPEGIKYFVENSGATSQFISQEQTDELKKRLNK